MRKPWVFLPFFFRLTLSNSFSLTILEESCLPILLQLIVNQRPGFDIFKFREVKLLISAVTLIFFFYLDVF